MTNETNKQKMHPYSQVLQWVAEGKEIEANTGCTLSGEVWIPAVTSGILNAANHFGNPEYYQPQDFRLKPERHIHQDLIDAWKNGAKIQCWSSHDSIWKNCFNPVWIMQAKYRIKPEPKPDTSMYAYIVLDEDKTIDIIHWTIKPCSIDNLKVVFCGETNKIKSVEII